MANILRAWLSPTIRAGLEHAVAWRAAQNGHDTPNIKKDPDDVAIDPYYHDFAHDEGKIFVSVSRSGYNQTVQIIKARAGQA